ncbi:hypothetical protein BDV95DRAFT_595445 [Massariosphaeria phaeospora]|uniref:DUF7730 domain-containing protein n=1 Tax=Massariosphaeria phaeospora TaxID=100035 RepID=A0A7C8M553_9PLEO|nr:hypothetical protein BDV95DRAFT_595445 [Massariosphaeria phaeospora]
MRPIRKICLDTLEVVCEALWKQYQKTSVHKKRKAHRVRKREEERRQKRLQELSPPLVVERDYALSLSEEMDSGVLMRKCLLSPQTDCLLLRLPMELRLAVYEEMFGQEEVHVMRRDDKLHSFRCRATAQHKSHDAGHGYNKVAQCGGGFESFRPLGLGVLPLLQSCRMIYSELVPLLYSEPTFFFHSLNTMLAFSGTSLPQRFHAITSIRIDGTCEPIPENWALESAMQPLNFHSRHESLASLPVRNPFPSFHIDHEPLLWTAACAVLARMAALRKLKMSLTCQCFRKLSAEVIDKAVLGPLVELGKKKQFQEFLVNVNWKGVENWDVGDGCPFVLSRDPRHLPPCWARGCYEQEGIRELKGRYISCLIC